MKSLRTLVLPLGLAAAAATALAFTVRPGETATPPELVSSYDSLADAILAVKKTEAHLVGAILGGNYAHAQATLEHARAALAAGDAAKAKAHQEALAALVAQMATEGDNAVAGVRKRLLEGGHHHNAEGEKQGIYDEGFVIVTRTAKKALLDASKAIASAKDRAALDGAWAPVETTMKSLDQG